MHFIEIDEQFRSPPPEVPIVDKSDRAVVKDNLEPEGGIFLFHEDKLSYYLVLERIFLAFSIVIVGAVRILNNVNLSL